MFGTAKLACVLALGLSSVALASAAGGTEPIRVLLITGQQNHDWVYTSNVHKQTLEATGRFKVDLTTTPAETLANAKNLKGYQVFFLDYNGARWGDAAEKNFIEAVNGGAGVVCVHASNNSFVGWAEYEKMIGLLWVTGTTSHGKFHTFDVNYTTHDDPITKGLADMKDHPDELYHKLVNIQKVSFKLLADAMSSTESGGSGNREPMALTVTYGKGRIFHTPLGHVWANSPQQHGSINDPNFKILLTRGTEWAATGAVTLPATWTFGDTYTKDLKETKQPEAKKATEPAPNTLSDAEKAAGWTLLFDGKSTPAFRGFKKDAFPTQGWEVADGAIHVKAKGNGGDIITKDQYEDFEFAFDWKVAAGANSGVMYLVTEGSHDYPWRTGPEYQVLDNKGHVDGKEPKTSAASCYALYAPAKDVTKPIGEWNAGKIVKKGKHIEHWLNGVKACEYEIGSDAWKKQVAASKFKDMPDYGTNAKGHIDLQEHGDDVWYRNIKVRVVK